MKFTSWMVLFLHVFDVFGVKPLSGDCRILRKIKGKNGAVIDKLSDSWFNVDEEILILDVLVNEAIPEVKSDQSADDLLGQIRDIRHGVFCAVLVIEFVPNIELMIFQSKFFLLCQFYHQAKLHVMRCNNYWWRLICCYPRVKQVPEFVLER